MDAKVRVASATTAFWNGVPWALSLNYEGGLHGLLLQAQHVKSRPAALSIPSMNGQSQSRSLCSVICAHASEPPLGIRSTGTCLVLNGLQNAARD